MNNSLYQHNPHGLLYTGDPDLPLEGSYPFIGMAGMGLGGLLTKAAMKTPVRSLIRKEPTLPKVTVKSKRPVKKKTKKYINAYYDKPTNPFYKFKGDPRSAVLKEYKKRHGSDDRWTKDDPEGFEGYFQEYLDDMIEHYYSVPKESLSPKYYFKNR